MPPKRQIQVRFLLVRPQDKILNMATKKLPKIKLNRDDAYDLWASKLEEAGLEAEHSQDLFDSFAEMAESGDYDMNTLLMFIDSDIDAINDND